MAEKGGFYGLRVSPNSDIRCFWIPAGDTLEVQAAGEQLAFKVTQPEQSEPANGSPLISLG